MNSGNSGFRSLPAQLSVAKSVPNLPFATSLLHRIGENIGGTLTLRKNSSSNLKNGPNNVVKVQVPPQRNTNHHHNFSNKPNSVKYRNALNRKKSASLEPMKVTSVNFELNFSTGGPLLSLYLETLKKQPCKQRSDLVLDGQMRVSK